MEGSERRDLSDFDPNAGVPFLLAPDGSYDIDLNHFFTSDEMTLSSPHTRAAYARDMCGFLSFVAIRKRTAVASVWKDIQREDRRAYAHWRNKAEAGPRVAASTWNRESAGALRFFRWALQEGLISESPVGYSQREGGWRRSGERRARTVVAERRSGGSRGHLTWMTGAEYRRWRDVGVRGFTESGVRPIITSRSMSGRDSAYVDMMVRTGLRLTEQSSLIVTDVPARDGSPYVSGDLPSAIAKNESGRRVYYADSVLTSVEAYLRSDRAWSVRQGARNDLYVPRADTWVIRSDDQRWAHRGSARVRTYKLKPHERLAALVEGPDGYTPAALWLSSSGRPMTTRGWQSVFERASNRCVRLGVGVRATPHVLRHSFAVATLEQIQRGHNSVLASKNDQQRRHYQMVFGDPLNFLRLLLGHRSIETTSIYLHALAEIELETRLMLLGDDWGLPPEARVTPQEAESGAS